MTLRRCGAHVPDAVRDAALLTHPLATDLPGARNWPTTEVNFILIQTFNYMPIPAAAVDALPAAWSTMHHRKDKAAWP